MTDAVERLLEQLWAVHRDRTRERLDTVVAGVEALAHGGRADTEALAGVAHVLAGALGTYGRPGSPLLRDVELTLLGRQVTPTPAELVPLLQDLRRTLEA